MTGQSSTAGGNGADLDALRRAVRSFVRAEEQAGTFVPGIDTWHVGHDPEFSRKLASRGWVGMCIPEMYGGHGRSQLERFAVTEELLAAGAPVAAHWIADRQVAPGLLKHGTAAQQSRFLPAIARAEMFFAIGMSEPEAGSDLAGVRTRAVRCDGGWRLSGTKLWTTGAHRAHAFVVLARSAAVDEGDRHAGLSQFIVHLDAPGVEVRPVLHMSGDHHFNEVLLDDVFVPDDLVLGVIGEGWKQVTEELSFERSGPERFLSTVRLLRETVEHAPYGDPDLGALSARLIGLHRLSGSVTSALADGDDIAAVAALVKLMGTGTEGDIVAYAERVLAGIDRTDREIEKRSTSSPDRPARLDQLLREALLLRPVFTLRGGTSEILRGVVARELGVGR